MQLNDLNISLKQEIKILESAAKNGNISSMIRLSEIYTQMNTDESNKIAKYWCEQAGITLPTDRQ